MSHLLHNPYNKPSPFDLSRVVPPLTPPDTDSDYVGQPFRSAPVRGTDALDADPIVPLVSAVETSTPSFRRQPSVSYVHSGPRDFRERGTQRSMIKWLVVVVPPLSFSREHGHLGHTLSFGSPDRLSQGILMPLFPTMGNQLSAIAREFSLPSTTGLCLYLHANHNGISLHPRITDESWQLLWAHLFDVRGSGLQQTQLPIGGQIELDIDLNKARWYESWVAYPRKEYADVPQSVASHSHRPSMTHWRGDSRTTFLDDQADEQDSHSVVQQLKAPRMVPRKLSLLDRFDISSTASTSKPARHQESPQSPLSEAQYRVLSPIAQEEEPQTARKDINMLVSAWRAGAAIVASPLAATGQTSLDAANMPNMIADIPTAEAEDDPPEQNLDDYAWSVSSLGPVDYEVDDVDDSESWRLPSPDLAHRQLSDAPPTPTTATSWGPPLSYPPSPIYAFVDYDSSVGLVGHAQRPHASSIHLAGRAEFSRPVTPMTATSWGASSYLTSPVRARSGYAESVDLGQRAISSRPATPSTATSWGPPSWPASPIGYDTSMRVASPGLADRDISSVPMTPLTATSWGAPSSLPSPAMSDFRVGSPDLGARNVFSPPSSPLPLLSRTPVMPSYQLRGEKWELVWPNTREKRVREQSEPHEETRHPSSLLVFPYYTVRWSTRRTSQSKPVPLPLSKHVFPYYSAPDTAWKHVWPYQAEAEREYHVVVKYPYFNLYPAVYPAFDLYPSTVRVAPTRADKERTTVLAGMYAAFNLYPAVYPHFEVYPASARNNPEIEAATIKASSAIQVKVPVQYPVFDLYPAVYPCNLERIYSDIIAESSSVTLGVKLSAAYPTFDIYPAVYPRNLRSIYPSVKCEAVVPVSCTRFAYPYLDIYPAIQPDDMTVTRARAVRRMDRQAIATGLSPQYPEFDLYPAVYPHSLRGIYPPQRTRVDIERSSSIIVELPTMYPSVVIYPAVYPWNLKTIYPPVHQLVQVPEPASKQGVTGVFVKLPVHYSPFDPYPAVYPYSLEKIYPSLAGTVEQAKIIDASLPIAYPLFDLYPAVYPHNMHYIYPADARIHGAQAVRSKSDSFAPAYDSQFVFCAYICPYSGVDPFLIAHPELADGYHSGWDEKHTVQARESNYPVLNIYPAVYPFFDIYPEVARPVAKLERETKVCLCETRYPALNIYPAVYPSFCLYPEVMREVSLGTRQQVHATLVDTWYPTVAIYPAVYPHFNLYAKVSEISSLVSRELAVSKAPTQYPVLDIYPAVYPHINIYPTVSTPLKSVHTKHVYTVALPSAFPSLPLYSTRRKPRYTHAELHDQVLREDESDEPCEGTDLWEMVTSAAPITVQNPPTGQSQPAVAIHNSPRRIMRHKPKFTHTQLHEQVFGNTSDAELQDTVPSLPQHTDPTAPPVLRSRSRAGSLASRPIPPPKPPTALVKRPPPPPPRTTSLHRPPANMRPSMIPGPSSTRPVSVMGLPSHPATTRMASGGMRPVSSAVPKLPSATEPSHERQSSSHRLLPRVSLERIRELDTDVRGSTSAPRSSIDTVPPSRLGVAASQELSRSNTLPVSKTGRNERRMSIVLEKARAYDHTTTPVSPPEEKPVRMNMATLSEFPTPPRPPLPTAALPNSRPISKLDRSRYPFAQ